MSLVLFVSHSSRDSQLAEDVAHLVDVGGEFKSVLDLLHLEQGDTWRPQLFQWMARCHAALILLTDEAVQSNWVLQEATVLRARQALEPGFRVFVVVPPAVKAAYPARWKLFEPLALDEIQGVRSDDAATIAAKIRPALQAMIDARRQTLFDRLSGVLGDILRDLVDKPHTLADVSDHLAIRDAEWTAIVGGNDTLVDLIARRLCRGDLGGYGELRDLLAALQSVGDRDLLQRLLTMLSSYWVVPAAAAFFPTACAAAPPRLIAMRASKPDFLPLRHLERVYRPYAIVPEIVPLSGGNENRFELEAQLIRKLKDVLGYEEGDLSDEDLFALLEEDEAERSAQASDAALPPRIFVLLPGLVVPALALELARAFPTLVFVVSVADANVLASEWSVARRVEPAVEHSDELRRSAELTRATRLIA